MKISKELFRLIFELYASQEWLSTRQDQLFETLDLCESIDEQNLLTFLLRQFVYVRSSKLSESLNSLADLICGTWNLDKTRTQLVATTPDHNPDSAQAILWYLKPLLQARGWNDVVQKNLFTRSFRDLATFPIVVLIDEFCGTGKTLRSRIKSLKSAARQREEYEGTKIDLQIYVAVVASMEDALPVVRAECAKFEAQILLKKGISGYFVNKELKDAVENMTRLESALKQDVKNIEFHSFGYGKAEALYSLENGNTPNSVFPIFWWRYLKDGNLRTPILERQESQN